jgi:acyl-CoA synthetase (AMP-forming)/AMP-acid ligase II
MLASQTPVRTMRDVVERNARLHGDDLHLVFGERRSTFAQYASRAMRLAGALYVAGLRSQDRISILAMNCPEYLEAYGVSEVAPYILAPINYRLASPEIVYIVGDASPRVLFFERQYEPIIDALRGQLRSVERYVCIGGSAPDWASDYETFLMSGSVEGPPLQPSPADVTAIMYTSGTTGRPKGAMITHEAMIALCECWSYELAADLGDRILLSMPFFHIGARSQGGAVTYRGGSLVVHRAFDAVEIVKTVERERITQLHLAPTLLQAVLDLPDIDRYDLSSLKTLNYAAAPMPLTVLKRAMKRFGPILINGYGQTEGAGTTLRKYYHRPEGTEKDLKRLTSIGQPVLSTSVRIVDEHDIEVPAGTIGEICLRSPQNMAGYWNNGVASAEALRGGWLHTGDMGYADADGFIYLADRKKDMIVSGGENVYSREVEEALMAHPSVADAAVIGVPDERWGEAVKAVVVLKGGAAVSAEILTHHCRTLIAGYKCPKSIEFLADLPRLPSGKVSKLALRERYRQHPQA